MYLVRGQQRSESETGAVSTAPVSLFRWNIFY